MFSIHFVEFNELIKIYFKNFLNVLNFHLYTHFDGDKFYVFFEIKVSYLI